LLRRGGPFHDLARPLGSGSIADCRFTIAGFSEALSFGLHCRLPIHDSRLPEKESPEKRRLLPHLFPGLQISRFSQ
jgi:hypothetical protein